MRVVFAFLMLLCSALPALADDHDRLYQAAGWPEQRSHFSDALSAAQQRYSKSLPPAVYQALVDNSNRRFAPRAVEQRAQAMLRTQLPNPTAALQFFQSPLGRKIVAAEVLATRSDQLAKNSKGLPQVEASATRRLLVRHLAEALPIQEGATEVSMALAGVAADSLSQMVPGLLGGGQAQALLNTQREQLRQQIGNDLDNTLLHVYRELSDIDLDEFVTFAQSPDGQAYYQAALAAIRAGLAADGAGSGATSASNGY
ncbi:hypothetical protein [Pseudomonas sp. LRF_L74]|uniref:hypothetical protein n=1 Tax=Pseudomonas sp. LRF_L74 TaxID=3369422 RepID=UPI003F5E1B54